MTIEVKKATLRQVAELMRMIADGIISGSEVQEIINRSHWTPTACQRLARKCLRDARKQAQQECQICVSFPDRLAMIAETTKDEQDLTLLRSKVTEIPLGGNRVHSHLNLFTISGEDRDLLSAKEAAQQLRESPEYKTISHHLVEVWAHLYKVSRQDSDLIIARELAQQTEGHYVDAPLAWLSIAQVSRNVEDCEKAWGAASSLDNYNAMRDAENLLADIYLEKKHFEVALDCARGASEDTDPDWPDIFLCKIVEEIVCYHLKENNLTNARETARSLEGEIESEKHNDWLFTECQIRNWQEIARKSKDTSDVNHILKIIEEKKYILDVKEYLDFITILLACEEISSARKMAQAATSYVNDNLAAEASAMAYAELGAATGKAEDFEMARKFVQKIHNEQGKTKSLIRIGHLSGNPADLAAAKQEMIAVDEKDTGGSIIGLREELFKACIQIGDFNGAHKEIAKMRDHDRIKAYLDLYKCLTEKALAK